ncbi:LANO_0A03862g1_1 [Lachancea nothofagi CBS 11611]|uniref:DASH complex subunit DAD1 n=1 Tax=Lachancea nothofagi CBS 11611 TaxID=1266666 RepID=A0A1G4IQF3_9SACH|nr:LANO_0A03862g1_1 [Lachancea nothofagi CBS 11611]
MSERTKRDDEPLSDISDEDRYFIEQRDLVLQDIGQTMDSILNNLNGLNISLENFIAVGKEFESVSDLWSKFYAGVSSAEIPDVEGNVQEQAMESQEEL